MISSRILIVLIFVPFALYLGCASRQTTPAAVKTSPVAQVIREQDQIPSSEPYASPRPSVGLEEDERAAPLTNERLPDSFRELPLTSLVPELEGYLRDAPGTKGIGVVVPSEGVVYSWNGHSMFYTASLFKVVIMEAAMYRAAEEGRALTAEETSLLQQMIVWSDNDAADALWYRAGGASGISSLLAWLGLQEIEPDAAGFWGESRASPADMALFLAKLAWDDELEAPGQELALELMTEVVPSQAWGVTAGIPPEFGGIFRVGVKNGWYPMEDGWIVNSGGVVFTGDGRSGYSLVIMTAGQPSMGDGIDLIEHVAALLHRELLKHVTPKGTSYPRRE